jgi:hypothetical protein
VTQFRVVVTYYRVLSIFFVFFVFFKYQTWLCRPSGACNFEVATRFLENVLDPPLMHLENKLLTGVTSAQWEQPCILPRPIPWYP